MRVTARGNAVNLKLEDKNTGTLYANCPVESYPGTLILIVCVCVRNRFRWPWQTFHGYDLRKLFNALFILSHRIKFIYFAGVAIEAVSDSSRYFVVRVVDDNGTWPIELIYGFGLENQISICSPWLLVSGRTAYLGLGFGDRSDSFDLNVALQDHFKWVKNQEKIEQDNQAPKQEMNLGFKEGETIKINMKITVSTNIEITILCASVCAAWHGVIR